LNAGLVRFGLSEPSVRHWQICGNKDELFAVLAGDRHRLRLFGRLCGMD
jgi:hypothetical protein